MDADERAREERGWPGRRYDEMGAAYGRGDFVEAGRSAVAGALEPPSALKSTGDPRVAPTRARLFRVGLVAAAVLLFANAVAGRAGAADSSQIVYGPLMLALETSYQKWLATNGVSPPENFQATLDANSDSYTVRFEATAAHHTAEATYSVAENSVLDYTFGAAPTWWTFWKGPATMRGAYVMAFDAAYQYRKKNPPAGKALAQLSSDASYVVVRVATWLKHNDYWVTLNQMPLGTLPGGMWRIGCDVQQEYLVSATTFAVKYEPGCLPM
jgi:hypothetical protein